MRLILWAGILILVAISCWRSYKRGNLMSVLITLLFILISVITGLALTLYFSQSRMLYQPSRMIFMTPDRIGLDYENLSLQTADGQTLSAWYVPADPNSRTVLFCHGNAGNNSHRLDTLKMFYEMGLNCLIVDYRGYGQSTGKPTEEGTVTDIKTGWNWLIEDKGLSPEQIIIFGRSLGGSVAAIIAQQVNPGGVVLESTFTSFNDIGAHYYPFLPVRLFTQYDYNTLDAVKEIRCPTMVIHSPDDEIVPYKFGLEIYKAAPDPKRFAELKGTHNEGFYDNSGMYYEMWSSWLENLPAACNIP